MFPKQHFVYTNNPKLRKMVEKAFSWADTHKKTRVNAVHGEPEAFLLLNDEFEITVMDVEENEHAGTIEVEEFGGKKW